METDKISYKPFYKQITNIVIVTISILGSIASIYAIVSAHNNVSLQCDIISSTNVLDINADISDVDILFKNNSLKKEKKNLKLIILKIKNNGTVDILKSYYDENDPFGFKPLVGKIVEKPEITETSNSYLKENLSTYLDTTGIAYVSNVIIDSKEYFTLKFLMLVDYGLEPKFEIIGKIAGIKKKIKIGILETQFDLPFYKEALWGGFLVQIFRGLVYFLIIVAIIFASMEISEVFSKWVQKRKRNNIVENFKNLKDYSFKHIDNIIFEKYKEGSAYELLYIKDQLEDTGTLYENSVILSKELEEEKVKSDKLRSYTDKYYSIKDKLESIDELVVNGFVSQGKDTFVVNEHLKDTLSKFLAYANIKPLKVKRIERVRLMSTGGSRYAYREILNSENK